MNARSRSHSSVINISVSMVTQMLTLVLSFVTRTIFIRLLGTEYLGLNGLYSNILSVLSLADLGIGSAMLYSLYKPIRENNRPLLAALIQYYRSVYIKIAVGVSIVGLTMLPILQYIVNTEVRIENQELYYVLFLMNSVVSYLFAYKRAIINADQKMYVIKYYDLFFNVFKNIFQIMILVVYKNYIAFLVVQLLCTALNNYFISRKADKDYPFIKEQVYKLPENQRNEIFENVKSMFIYRLGGVVLNSTDNILISTIIGTIWVGYYSNYFLIVGTVITMTNLVFSAITSSVGNLNSTNDSLQGLERSNQVFNALNFMNFWVYGFSSIALFGLLNDFITLWLGKDFLLNDLVVIAIVMNVYIPGMLQGVSSYRNTTGLFRDTKYIFLMTAFLNIVLSIYLGNMFGLHGILFATVISRLLTNFWFEPMMLYKKVFRKSPKSFYFKQIKYLMYVLMVCTILYLISLANIKISYLTFFVKSALILFTNIFVLILYRKSEEYIYIYERIGNVFRR